MMGGLMLAAAVVIDLIQLLLTLIPFMGWLVSWVLSICTWMLFSIWFHHFGVNLYSQSRILGTLGTILAEFVPFINGFFWWTLRVWAALYNEWNKKSV